VLSRPVTYLTLSATGAGDHDVSALIDVDPVIAVNTADEAVIWGRSRAQGLTVLNAGSRDQRILNRSGDDVRIDWGYFHLAAPDGEGAEFALSPDAMRSFASSGTLPDADDTDMPRLPGPRDHTAHLDVMLPMGKLSATPVVRHVLFAYTENYAIEYLNRKLRPYWQRNGMTVEQMLAAAESQYASLEQRGQKFDSELTADLEKAGARIMRNWPSWPTARRLPRTALPPMSTARRCSFPKRIFPTGVFLRSMSCILRRHFPLLQPQAD